VALRVILRNYANRFYRRASAWFQIANPLPNRTGPRLEAQVVDDYLKNLRLAEGAAASLSIPILIYWQPVLSDKSPLSPFEASLERQSRESLPGREQFGRDIHDQLHAAATSPEYRGPRIIDLSTILNGQASCFFDLVHTTETCNAIIASRIVADAIPLLRAAEARDRMAPRFNQSPSP